MEKQYHIQMTRRALGPYFGVRALKVILDSNTGQDSLRNLLHGEFHFDANAFEQAYRYTENQRRMILESAGLAHGRIQAWAALGRWSHALQDFYSHTNYVALWRAFHGPGTIDPLAVDILESSELFAARVYYPLEALTYFKSLRPLMRRLLPPDSHANMNLDSPRRGPRFADAIAAAESRTALEFQRLLAVLQAAIEPEALARFLDRQPERTG